MKYFLASILSLAAGVALYLTMFSISESVNTTLAITIPAIILFFTALISEV